MPWMFTEGKLLGFGRRTKPLIIWSSEKGSMVDALALSDEEGRGKLRKAWVRSKHPLIPG